MSLTGINKILTYFFKKSFPHPDKIQPKPVSVNKQKRNNLYFCVKKEFVLNIFNNDGWI